MTAMAIHDYDVVIFDLDGVLTDTAEYHYLAWKRLADHLGVPFTRADNEGLKGLSRVESLEQLLALGKLQHLGAEEKLKLMERKNADYVSLIGGMSPKDVLPGAAEVINTLRGRGKLLGLASASKNAPFVMGRLGLTREFDAIVDAGTVANSKPHPEVFLRAAHMLGVEPARCIGVEDAVAGVQAIKSAGMPAVAIGQHSLFPHADVVFASTQALSGSGFFAAASP